MSNHLLQRARLLRERRRFEDAIAALREYLACEPESFHAFYELAVTRLLGEGDYKAGLSEIEQAIAISPDSGAAHSVRSALLHALGRFQDALIAAGQAKRLDPGMPYAWFCEGNALLAMGSLNAAEKAARKALELDPDHPSAPHLLTAVLRLQRRFGEAGEVNARHLESDPENARAFSQAGWIALNQGEGDKAENLFRESLRLDPGAEHARLGLREAFKARSAFYRFHQRYLSFVQQQTEVSRGLGVIALVVAPLAVWAILTAMHPLAVVPFIASFLLLFGSWLGSGFGHLMVLKDPLARHSLKPGEKLDGLVVGSLFLGGMVALVLGAAVVSAGTASLGGAMMGAAVPASFICVNPSTKGRLVFSLISFAVISCGIVALIRGPHQTAGLVSIIVAMLVVFVTPKISMVPSLRRKKPG